VRDRRGYEMVEDSREPLVEIFLRKLFSFSSSLFDQYPSRLLGLGVGDGENESDKQDEERSVAGTVE